MAVKYVHNTDMWSYMIIHFHTETNPCVLVLGQQLLVVVQKYTTYIYIYIVKRLRDTAAQEVFSRFDEVVQMSWIESTFWKDLVRFCSEWVQDAVARCAN